MRRTTIGLLASTLLATITVPALAIDLSGTWVHKTGKCKGVLPDGSVYKVSKSDFTIDPLFITQLPNGDLNASHLSVPGSLMQGAVFGKGNNPNTGATGSFHLCDPTIFNTTLAYYVKKAATFSAKPSGVTGTMKVTNFTSDTGTSSFCSITFERISTVDPLVADCP